MEGAWGDWWRGVQSVIYLGGPVCLFPLLRGFQGGISNGFWWALVVLFGVWGFDTGAFFAGHFFGRHKLAPRISPGKTWEGVAGGLVLSVTAAPLLTIWPLGVPRYLAIPFGHFIVV